jgi:hypothetical protein
MGRLKVRTIAAIQFRLYPRLELGFYIVGRPTTGAATVDSRRSEDKMLAPVSRTIGAVDSDELQNVVAELRGALKAHISKGIKSGF